MQHFVTGVEKNTRLICWFMFLLRYPLEFMGLYETIWTLFGIKVDGIAIFGNGPNSADQAWTVTKMHADLLVMGIIYCITAFATSFYYHFLTISKRVITKNPHFFSFFEYFLYCTLAIAIHFTIPILFKTLIHFCLNSDLHVDLGDWL